jgi:glucosamine-6-phosphate deaminase
MKKEHNSDLDELISRITIAKDEERMGQLAASAIVDDMKEKIRERGRVVMLFASAPSQHSTWKAMIDIIKKSTGAEKVDTGNIIAFHMDEYLGLEPNAPQLFGKILRKMLFEPLAMKRENIHYFDDRVAFETAVMLRRAIASSAPKNIVEELTRKLESEAKRHLDEITKEFTDAGGVFDIVVGGIGKHPHIAFNDAPDAKFDEPRVVKVVRPSEISRQQQVEDGEFARLEDVPTHALTFTLPPIFNARSIYIIVPRLFKADAVSQTLDGKISEDVPASGLRQPHVLPKVRIYLDKDSASRSRVAQEAIRRKGYS